MKTLNTEELIALNSILGGDAILGVKLQGNGESEEKRVADVEKSLEEKEYMSQNDFTDLGLISIRFLEDYKDAKKHVFINNLRMALTEKTRVNIIGKEKEEYTFMQRERIEFIYELMKKIPFLQKAQKKRFFDYEKIKKSVEEIEERLESETWQSILVVQEYDKNIIKSYGMYYYNEGTCYHYDCIEEMEQERGAQDFRDELLEMFEIKEGVR